MLAFGKTQAFTFVSFGSLHCAVSAHTAIRGWLTMLDAHGTQTSNRAHYDQMEDDPAEDTAKPEPNKTA